MLRWTLMRASRPLFVAGAFLAATLLVARADDVISDPNNGYGGNNRPAHVFISVSDAFSVPDLSDYSEEAIRDSASSLGTPVVRAKLGTYVAGPNIKMTRYVTDGTIDIDLDGLPDDPETQLPPDFDDNQVTIVGSFKTIGPSGAIHLMTPYPGAIESRVQRAWFNASVFLDDADALPQFATTVQVALFVYDNQGAAGASVQEILDVVFGTVESSPPVTLACTTVCTSEGGIFPHDDDADVQFAFSLVFDDVDGSVFVDVCLPDVADLKPGNGQNRVNAKKDNVVVPIAILTTDDFDAAGELDPDTVNVVVYDADGNVVSSIAPDHYAIEDVDDDGDDDVVFHFSVADLRAGDHPALATSIDTIHLLGETTAGMCVFGQDSVSYVNSNH